MKIGIFGTGYVGLVTAAGFAEVGHNVACVDVDIMRIKQIQSGVTPIHEPGLSESLSKSMEQGNICFSTESTEVVENSSIIFIAVGTPAQVGGSANLSHVDEVAYTIGSLMTQSKTIVVKSTVPVGTARRVSSIIQSALDSRSVEIPFTVVSNPEFLKEGAALNDFRKPDRIIVGANDEASIAIMRNLYEPFSRNHEKLVVMSCESAELTKYAANAMLATRISFMNEIARLSENFGADIEDIRRGIGTDRRIGPDFLYAGAGFGGSCFPKDLAALSSMANDVGTTTPIIDAVQLINNQQKTMLAQKARSLFGSLKGLTCAVWGLSFKPNTDDVRESPSLNLIDDLIREGAIVRVYDPVVKTLDRSDWLDRYSVCESRESALDNADVLFLVTEWDEFKSLDLEYLASVMKQKVIIDGRNLWDPKVCRSSGFQYFGIGRP